MEDDFYFFFYTFETNKRKQIKGQKKTEHGQLLNDRMNVV